MKYAFYFIFLASFSAAAVAAEETVLMSNSAKGEAEPAIQEFKQNTPEIDKLLQNDSVPKIVKDDPDQIMEQIKPRIPIVDKPSQAEAKDKPEPEKAKSDAPAVDKPSQAEAKDKPEPEKAKSDAPAVDKPSQAEAKDKPEPEKAKSDAPAVDKSPQAETKDRAHDENESEKIKPHFPPPSPLPEIEIILTDKLDKDNVGKAKEKYESNIPAIHIGWKSNQLHLGQKIRIVWIAEDTNNVAPPDYKIVERTFELNTNFKSKMLTTLPGNYWIGKMEVTKPAKGWPPGKYYIEIYVDNRLAETINFTVVAATEGEVITKLQKVDAIDPTATINTWDSIAVDTVGSESEPYYGVGAGTDKRQAELNAINFCLKNGGQACKTINAYQHCGAYAIGPEVTGSGVGATKKAAEDKALAECEDKDCKILVSDCIE